MPADAASSGSSAVGPSAVRRALGLWIWSILLTADAVLLTRWYAGNFHLAAPEGLAFLSTALIALASWLAWTLQTQGDPQVEASPVRRLVPIGISLGITIGWSWAISSHMSPSAIGLLIGVILVHLMSAISVGFGSAVVVPKAVSSGLQQVISTEATKTALEADLDTNSMHFEPEVTASFDEDFEESASDQDDHQTLWLSRRTAGELELVEGWVRVNFASGQRETLMHVAFCPPLAGLPEIETEDLDGVGLEIRVAARFPFGARMSVRRSDSVEEEHSHRVGFAAQAIAIHRAA